MIELFSRAPEGLTLGEGSHLTPIPLDEAVSSLSAILLDDDDYAFIVAGRREVEGCSYVGEDRLIPLKARAWLELDARRAQGAPLDSRDVRKHANDVLRLSQLLAATSIIPVSEKLAGDLAAFIAGIAGDATIDAQTLGIRSSVNDICARLALAYDLAGTPDT